MAHVCGITDLALFAVVDDVHACRHLLADDVRHRVAHASLEGRGVRQCADVERLQSAGQIPRSWQATGVRGEDALRAALHRVPQSRAEARRAPSVSAASLAHTIVGWISSEAANDAKPQSAPAMTFSRPTTDAKRSIR